MKEKQARKCGDEDILRGREFLQMGWYELASTLVPCKTVLDVGCGSGEGLRLLTANARKAVGIDLDERLKRHDVEIQRRDISQVPDKSFDVVTCIDVIEHVEDDKAFIQQTSLCGEKTLFVSTPNYVAGRNLHPFHYREYTPIKFERLFSHLGNMKIGGEL